MSVNYSTGGKSSFVKVSSIGISMFNQYSFHNVLNITIKRFANLKKNICCDIFTASIFAIKAAETSLSIKDKKENHHELSRNYHDFIMPTPTRSSVFDVRQHRTINAPLP